jgi:hypothetical protein
MPRRISDYPDAFAGWNLISSFGSIISVVATWLFLYVVYIQLVEGKASTRYPWLTPQFYTDTLQTLLNRSYNSLEWALNSPPKPHAFVSLPLQSACSHVASGFCAFCIILDKVLNQGKSDCVHVFKPLIVKAHNIGIMCDLSGGDHMAVVHAASKASVCDLCNTVSCFVCLSP